MVNTDSISSSGIRVVCFINSKVTYIMPSFGHGRVKCKRLRRRIAFLNTEAIGKSIATKGKDCGHSVCGLCVIRYRNQLAWQISGFPLRFAPLKSRYTENSRNGRDCKSRPSVIDPDEPY